MIQWYIKPFSELTLTENQNIQKFMDVNGNNLVDRKAYYLWAEEKGQMIAYVRIYEQDDDLLFDRFKYNDPVDPEALIYRVLEVGSRFFECQIAKTDKPFDESLLRVYQSIGFSIKDEHLWITIYH